MNVTNNHNPCNIFDYTDYRCFLKQRFNDTKSTNSSFSYRNFIRKAGFKSSGFLKHVIDSKRNLAQEGIYKMCKGFDLKGDEARYFENLVKMNQATSIEEKDFYFREISKIIKQRFSKTVITTQYRMFTHWYYVAILELVRLDGFKNDPVWISKKLMQKVPLKKIEKAIDDLVELGFLKKRDDGTLERFDKMISTPDEVKSVMLFNFQHQMIDIGKEALNREKESDRDFSTLTIALSESNFKRLKNMVQEFRKKVHSELETDGNDKTTVAHMNVQLFQLTKPATKPLAGK